MSVTEFAAAAVDVVPSSFYGVLLAFAIGSELLAAGIRMIVRP